MTHPLASPSERQHRRLLSHGVQPGAAVARWPSDRVMDAVGRLAALTGMEASWTTLVQSAPVAPDLAERARLLPLDREILRHLPHLQHVCHRPRLHLRVEEERLPVSRARRTPVRAVADLVSHPGDWEHRSLRSIQPSRVLARTVEDEWNLYENRVAVRLVDALLAYLSKRLDDLGEISSEIDKHDDEMKSSYRRAERIARLWAQSLASAKSSELRDVIQRLSAARQQLLMLLDSQLYRKVPRREKVAAALKPTNILVNDPHYRKVAALWRSWVRYEHKSQESTQQRSDRLQREESAWDQFVLHLVARSFSGLGWMPNTGRGEKTLSRPGWRDVHLSAECGLIRLAAGERVLRIIPLCAELSAAEPDAWRVLLEGVDGDDTETVIAHVGDFAPLADADRASGWSLAGRAVLFPCSPRSISSEERMSRLIHGWLSRAASPSYPLVRKAPKLPPCPKSDWMYDADDRIVALRAPSAAEREAAYAWAAEVERELVGYEQRAKAAKQAFERAPRHALETFRAFIAEATSELAGLSCCPVCGSEGRVEPRRGKEADGSDATWWARCESCETAWGTRPCSRCRVAFHVLASHPGTSAAAAAPEVRAVDWPDRVLGRDVWAQPCQQHLGEHFRCSGCGTCSSGACGRCRLRLP